MEGNKKKTPVMIPYIAPISIVITCSLPGSAGNAKKKHCHAYGDDKGKDEG